VVPRDCRRLVLLQGQHDHRFSRQIDSGIVARTETLVPVTVTGNATPAQGSTGNTQVLQRANHVAAVAINSRDTLLMAKPRGDACAAPDLKTYCPRGSLDPAKPPVGRGNIRPDAADLARVVCVLAVTAAMRPMQAAATAGRCAAHFPGAMMPMRGVSPCC
jgi:hypothetical protein